MNVSFTFDGDLIKTAELKKGDQVRPLWMRLEHLTPAQMIFWVDRFDSLCPIAAEWALAQALEEAAGITVSERSQVVRTMLCEINRLVWLTTYLGRIMQVLGQTGLQERILLLREQVFGIQEELTGGRILPQALTLGGLRRSWALGDLQKVRNFLDSWAVGWNSWMDLIHGDPILESRLRGLLTISTEIIGKFSWWGVVGKAGGVTYDSRRHRPHGAYPLIDFDLIGRDTSDGWSRFIVALEEIQIALKIVKGCLERATGGDTKPSSDRELRQGYYFGAAESAKGPVISAVQIAPQGFVSAVRLFSTGNRVWPLLDQLFTGIRAEDFDLAFASLGIDPEDSEI